MKTISAFLTQYCFCSLSKNFFFYQKSDFFFLPFSQTNLHKFDIKNRFSTSFWCCSEQFYWLYYFSFRFRLKVMVLSIFQLEISGLTPTLIVGLTMNWTLSLHGIPPEIGPCIFKQAIISSWHLPSVSIPELSVISPSTAHNIVMDELDTLWGKEKWPCQKNQQFY